MDTKKWVKLGFENQILDLRDCNFSDEEIESILQHAWNHAMLVQAMVEKQQATIH